jgi:hypothetical protein
MRLPERGPLLLASPFMLLGLWCLLFWAKHSELDCRRGDGKGPCTLVSNSIARSERLAFDSTELVGARIEERTTTETDGSTTSDFRVMLQLRDGDHPFSTFGEGGGQVLVAAVNEFVAHPERPELCLRTDNRRFVVPMGLVILGFGVFVLRQGLN